MPTTQTFEALSLPAPLLNALKKLGYEAPTPIQIESIPVLLSGKDLLAQAQTGTGKTAAFTLPILTKLNLKQKQPQALVIAPTRELAIQVAEAFQAYAKDLKGFRVTPIYGGQDYRTQLNALKNGTHVIVGTPGRVMDHLRRNTLDTSKLNYIVLDEADEMLNMGFIEDVEWILEQIPTKHQTALFSATMPKTIQKIAQRYLHNPEHILIESKQNTAAAIDQNYLYVAKEHKLEALTRFLEVEIIDAAIIFSRTKTGSQELADKLKARGYRVAALNGDMNQRLRKQAVDQLKNGDLDILVATDVAARGIDVQRVTHVINFDIPYDTESYIHRIGRTGRAGRAGKSILFVSPREERLLKNIERAINQPIQAIDAPSPEAVQGKRAAQLAEKIEGIITKSKKLPMYQAMVEQIETQTGCSAFDVAAALLYLNQQKTPLSSAKIDKLEIKKMPQKRAQHKRSAQKRPQHKKSTQKRPQLKKTFKKRPAKK